jgi:hypothetical protein
MTDYEKIKQQTEDFAKGFGGRVYYEEWFNDKRQRMLKVVLTFKLDSSLPTE